MTNYYKITDSVPLPSHEKKPGGYLVKLIFCLEPGQSFLCPHQASSSLKLVQKTNPERVYRRHKDKATGGTRIYRIS